MEKKQRLLAYLIPLALTVAICSIGAIFLSRYMNFEVENTSSTTSSSSTSEEIIKPKWNGKIQLNIPTDTANGKQLVDLTNEVPFYENAFNSDRCSFSFDKTNPYVFNISLLSSDGKNVTNYVSNLENDNHYSYKCDDYFYDVIETGYVFRKDNHQLVVTPIHKTNVDELKIRYIPNGDYWPTIDIFNTFEDQVSSLIPGMKLNESPLVSEVVASTLTITYNASESEIMLYKQTLSYFNYKEVGGVFTNSNYVEMMIDMSRENQISITAPTK